MTTDWPAHQKEHSLVGTFEKTKHERYRKQQVAERPDQKIVEQ
jgi:hypothetical protein